MAKILTAETFGDQINSGKLVLVDFWASWCGPCKMLGPIIDALAQDNAGKAEVCKLNVDEADELAMQYGVSSIPCVILFKDGEVLERSVGFRQKAQLQEMINKYL